MADVITGNTQLTATKQALIASIVQKELAFQAKLLPTIQDYSMFAVKGAKSVSVPKFGSFTVVDRATATQGDASVLTATVDTIDLNYAAYIAWVIDSQDEIQSTVEVQQEFLKRAIAAHARKVDDNIVAVLESAGVEATTVAVNVTEAGFLEMREQLLTNHADRESLYFLCGPDQETKMLQIANFVAADKLGYSNIPNGMIGKIHGVNCLVHSGVAAGKFYMYEKTGLGIAFQQGAKYSEQGANEFGSSAKRCVIDQLYGVKEMQVSTTAKLIIKNNPA